ncbi:hypothetical protein ebA6643 [Aromatoleum aromaticum EbN1]|uniref:Uncharacterized protein n=1 Tax=Aromatoleum aromaticum (strain DSM 19018 / LMG 30748 / EbN1) TaxID=76114 RepID=Q5NYE7_AROAE|nr:hypothetical protein ebA6643 [Aromatoleum aromaticum EbN1]
MNTLSAHVSPSDDNKPMAAPVITNPMTTSFLISASWLSAYIGPYRFQRLSLILTCIATAKAEAGRVISIG